MYKYGFPARRWLPMLLIFLALVTLFSGGFHRPWFFFGPLLCVFPFLLLGGMAFLFLMHGSHNSYPMRRHGGWYNAEKHKRQDDSDSDIFYV